MMTTTSEASRKRDVFAGRDRLKGTADDTGHARKPGTEGEHEHEHQLNADAHRRQNVAIVDAGAHDHADAGAIEREPHRNADHDGSGEDHQAYHRVRQIDRLTGGLDGRNERRRDRTNQRAGVSNLIEVAAESPEHQIGKHDRQSDRHHRLAQVLALHAAEDKNLHGDADQRDDDKRGEEARTSTNRSRRLPRSRHSRRTDRASRARD